MKEKNTLVIVIIMILSMTVGALVSYIVVEKIYHSKNINVEKFNQLKETNVTNPSEQPESKTEEQQTIRISSVKDYPQANDKKVIEYGDLSEYITEDLNKTDFKNVTRNYLGSTITYNCTQMGEILEDVDVTSKGCYTVNINIDGKFNFETGTPFGYRGCSHATFTYQYNNYFINVLKEGCIGRREIKIYDKMGNLKKEINDVTKSYSEDPSYEKNHNTEVTLINNRIYFIKIIKEEDVHAQLSLNSINLLNDSLTEEVIQSFEGYIAGK